MARIDDSESDDEALRWEGDVDSGRIDPTLAAAAPGHEADVDPETGEDSSESELDAPRSRASSASLLATGIFAGIYLAFVIGWVVVTQRPSAASQILLVDILSQFGEFLAIAAAALWFLAVLLLTRTSGTLTRLGWLALGIPVVLPWPFVIGFFL